MLCKFQSQGPSWNFHIGVNDFTKEKKHLINCIVVGALRNTHCTIFSWKFHKIYQHILLWKSQFLTSFLKCHTRLLAKTSLATSKPYYEYQEISSSVWLSWSVLNCKEGSFQMSKIFENVLLEHFGQFEGQWVHCFKLENDVNVN